MPVSHYEAPYEFTGKLIKVTVTMDDDRMLDGTELAAKALGSAREVHANIAW